MRTTVRIDDDLLRELKKRAQSQGLSLGKLLNQVVRRGLRAPKRPPRAQPYREKVFAMGQPRMNLDKALALSAAIEDEEIARKLALRK